MATPERKPGSNLGRPAINWAEAFAVYASLPPDRRTYAAVAAKFKVSARTVERHGRVEKWAERIAAIDAQAAVELEKKLGQAQAEQTAEIIKLGKATLIRYADQLRSGDTRISASEFEKISKFLLVLMAESGHAIPTAINPPTPPQRSPEHKLEVLRALDESGALAALRAALEQQNSDNNDNPNQEVES